MISKKKFLSDVLVAFAAQLFAMIVSSLMSLVVPKLISGVDNFGYWQLFLFYSNYVSLSQFGIVDGIYLRLGGKDYSEINRGQIKAQYIVFVFVQICCFVLMNSFLTLFSDTDRRFVVFSVSIYMVVYNCCRFLGYIFLATGKTKVYSLMTILDRATMLCGIAVIICTNLVDYKMFVLSLVVSMMMAMCFIAVRARQIFTTKADSVCAQIKQTLDDSKNGLSVTIAGLAGTFILGAGRLVSDTKWGIEAFGKFSFAISLITFFLAFVNQVSIVFFPALKRMSDSQYRNNLFLKIRKLLSAFLMTAYIVCIPAKELLSFWLPMYKESLNYFVILVPFCIFDGKMQLLCNTYLKALGKVKFLMYINAFSMGISVIGSFISAYVFDSIMGIIFVLIVSIALRSVVSEIYLCTVMNVEKANNYIFLECLLAVLFVVAQFTLPQYITFVVFLLICIVVCVKTVKGELRFRKKDENESL